MKSNISDKFKVLLWGCGTMGKIILRYVQDNNHVLVGVIGHHDIGKDAGEVAGLAHCNVPITDEKDADILIEKVKPDICILCTRSTMKEIAPSLRILSEHGVNTATIAEESFYSWNTSPDLTKELHQLFVKNNCTLTGTGYQDVLWGYLPVILTGCSHRIDRIECFCQWNFDDYGKSGFERFGIGETKEVFYKKTVDDPNRVPSFALNSNAWICERLGLKIKSNKEVITPITLEKDIECKTMGSTIRAGCCTGLKSIVTTETTDGIVIEMTMLGQVYHSDMVDICTWTFKGEPDIELIVKKPASAELTCATVVNRLGQIIDAEPGYVTTNKLGPIEWKCY